MIEEILKDLREQMSATADSLKRDLARVRAGRAAPSVLDGVKVEYYGSETPLNKLATVSAPEARLLLVQPFDQTSVGAIEKAIRMADLGLSPINDGKLLRIPVPELTEERRRDLVKQARKEAEHHRVSARNHRRDALAMLKDLLAEKEISEDDMHSAQEQVQKATDSCIEQIDDIVARKEEDIMAV